MRRTLCLLAAVLLAGCGGAAPEAIAPAVPAGPQHAELDWRESYPPTGERLVFTVETLDVTDTGWSARVAVRNETRIPFETGRRREDLSYGLMLFASGDLEELEAASTAGTLPPARTAETLEPPPPTILEPGATWRTTISAPGALAQGSWARVAFGPLRAIGDPPEGMQPVVLWITDHAHRL